MGLEISAATAAYLAIASAAVGTGVSVYSQQQQAKTQEAAAEYNAKLAENEALNIENEAAERHRRESVEKRRELAKIRASLAAQGTLTTSGTPLAILGESSANMNTRIADAFRASNMQAASARSQGAMGLWEASQARTAANLSSVATGLSGISSGISGYYGFQNNGNFTTRTKSTP
jgi:hypothetical protein